MCCHGCAGSTSLESNNPTISQWFQMLIHPGLMQRRGKMG
ncbi:hypothetical protein RintRC_3898 [Richelia intracellularis]|nr:hypothetical protein RintRC_3898 [Richelia intracellularis]